MSKFFWRLSLRLLLVFSHTPTYPRVTPLKREQTNDVNRMIVHYAFEEFVSWKGEVRDDWFASTGPLPEDAYQDEAIGMETNMKCWINSNCSMWADSHLIILSARGMES
jgi:hypothetical protein